MDHYKTCKKCGQSFPLTTEHFYKNPNTRDSFVSTCKKCMQAAARIPDEQRKRFPIRDGMQHCYCCKQWKPMTEEYFDRNQGKERGFSNLCKDCAKQKRRIPEEQKKRHVANRPGERRCPVCETWHPLDHEHFHRSGNDYTNICRQCSNNKHTEYRRKLGKPIAPRSIIKDGQKCCSQCGNWYPHSAEFFTRTKNTADGLKSYCKTCQKAMMKKWSDRNPGAKERAVRRWYERNGTAYHKQWREKNPGLAKFIMVRRRARKMSLPDTMTESDWKFALHYFDHKCAVCGRPAGFWHTIAADHWIPLAKGGATVRSNIIPLCHGVGGCNNKKSDQLPADWLLSEFGRRKAKVILKRIEDYFRAVQGRPLLNP